MVCTTRWIGYGLGAVLALGAWGCSDPVINGTVVPTDAGNDGGNFTFGDGHGDGKAGDGGTGVGDAAAGTDEDGAPVGSDVVLGSQLRFVDPIDDFELACETTCAKKMNQNGQLTLGVEYVKDGQPVGNALVEFALKDPQSTLGEVLSGMVPTGDDGRAYSEVKSGSAIGIFEVIARVPDDPAAGELVFPVHVTSKAKGPLTITLHYKGDKALVDFGALKARLTKQTTPGQPACAQIDLGDTLPKAEWESPPNLKWDKPWTLNYPAFMSWLPQNGEEVAFTVVGIAATTSTSMPLAAGCVDTGATVKWDPVTKTMQGDSIVVDVYDIPPRLKGTYDLVSRIDMVSILPDPVENVLKTILDIVSDPVAGVLSLACKLANGSLDSLCKNIFVDPKNPSIKDLAQPFGGVIVKFLDAILLGFLPENIKNGLATGADLAEILTNLEMGGVIEIKAEPDNTGFLAKDFTKATWMSVTYKWSLGQSCNKFDPNCGKKTFNIEAFQNDAIVGQFDLWRDALKWEVKIGKHSLNIKWGALVNYIVQKQLLPALTYDPKDPTAPVIDTYAKLIKSLLAGKKCLVKDTCCDEFGAQLASKQGLLKADFLSSTCEILVTLGTGFLEAQLTQLDANTGDPSKNSGLLLGADNCPIFEANQDQLIDNIGAPTDMCEWDMTLTIGGKPQPIKSKFYATRQQ